MQLGTVQVTLGGDDELVKIDAEGEIFPVLLCECVRGFMELFASHGLPKDKNILDIVLQKAATLPCKKFNFFIKEVLAKTRTGKRLMAKLIEKAKNEKEYEKFYDKMTKLQTNKNLINDEYIHTEEL